MDIAKDQNILRLSIFIGLFLILKVVESFRPLINQRKLSQRFFSNIFISCLSVFITGLVYPLTLTKTAEEFASRSYGLFSKFDLPLIWEIIFAVLLFDMAIYWQHRIFHKINFFWKFHRVHHADYLLDVSSGIRFHPIEILISFAIKVFLIAALGAPAEAVIIFEIILSSTSLFNHSNIKLPRALEKICTYIIVTPEYHRVHHSTKSDELNTNFSFNFPWWDMIFNSHLRKTQKEIIEQDIGLTIFRETKDQSLLALLLQPFKK